MQMFIQSSKLPAVLLLVLLLFATFAAARSLAAAIIAWPATAQMEKDDKRVQSFLKGEWRELQELLRRARNLEPENPEYLQLLGSAGMYRYLYASSGDQEAVAARREAETLFRQALSARPSWPHDHIHYLLAKYRLGEVDEDFFRHFRYANVLGPWESWVQQVTVELGLQLENRLNSHQREIFHRSIRNGIRHPDGMQDMLGTLRRYQELRRVCDAPPNQGVEQYCRRYFSEGD